MLLNDDYSMYAIILDDIGKLHTFYRGIYDGPHAGMAVMNLC